MEGLAKFIMGGQILFGIVCVILIIYLIFRKIDKQKGETFEDREN